MGGGITGRRPGGGGRGRDAGKTWRLERSNEKTNGRISLGRNSRLPLDGGGAGVSLGLAGEQHVGSTHVPVVVVANYSHLRGIWIGRKKKG